jgi:hypothetical protein
MTTVYQTCAFVLDQINEAVKRVVSADRTEH